MALNPAKAAFAPLKGRYELDATGTFIESLRRGFEKVTPLRGKLAKAHSLTPWDGEDAIDDEEEEFSLDEILGDEMPTEDEE